MTGFVYPIIEAWVWGEGWLHKLGFEDFAGSGVVHLTGGISGLIGTIVIGPRHGRFDDDQKVVEKEYKKEEQNDVSNIKKEELDDPKDDGYN
jgi:ammonia channel protein AmtB